METRRRGDTETRRRGDTETRRRGDAEIRRHGDTETANSETQRHRTMEYWTDSRLASPCLRDSLFLHAASATPGSEYSVACCREK